MQLKRPLILGATKSLNRQQQAFNCAQEPVHGSKPTQKITRDGFRELISFLLMLCRGDPKRVNRLAVGLTHTASRRLTRSERINLIWCRVGLLDVTSAPRRDLNCEIRVATRSGFRDFHGGLPVAWIDLSLFAHPRSHCVASCFAASLRIPAKGVTAFSSIQHAR